MNRRPVLFLLSLGVAAIATGALFARMLSGGVSLESGTWLPRARTLTDFHLQDMSGRAFDLNNLRGHPTLLFFGFTNCPDVCPTTLATLEQVLRQAPLAGARVVFVSVDPERDSDASLQTYLGAFDKNFIGVPGGGYTMDHSATLYLLDTQGRLAAVFSPPFSSAKLTADLHQVSAARRL
jgi:protein SCO1/2